MWTLQLPGKRKTIQSNAAVVVVVISVAAASDEYLLWATGWKRSARDPSPITARTH